VQHAGREIDHADRPTPNLVAAAAIMLQHQIAAVAHEQRMQAAEFAALQGFGQPLTDIGWW
jgi:hypothetical protein